jgi:hypothetical protein
MGLDVEKSFYIAKLNACTIFETLFQVLNLLNAERSFTRMYRMLLNASHANCNSSNNIHVQCVSISNAYAGADEC